MVKELPNPPVCGLVQESDRKIGRQVGFYSSHRGREKAKSPEEIEKKREKNQ